MPTSSFFVPHAEGLAAKALNSGVAATLKEPPMEARCVVLPDRIDRNLSISQPVLFANGWLHA
jgi:hypothetical protein